ncbi:NAD(P)-binding protein [Cytophagaceae bacterium ABcell3]|nr:NAD(P)-binding protein [Cytophagaceae bacterium ABcell3]
MEKYDIIIIGSGLGGLECGSILSKEGYNVLVLEKNKQLGGNLQTFVRDKQIFDTGIHYIGGLDENQNLNQYFKYLGIMDNLRLKKLDENGFDIITFEGDDTAYRYGQGYDNFINILSSYFPQERKAISDFCDKIKEVCESFPLYNLKVSNLDFSSIPFLTINARDFIASFTKDEKLRSVLAGTNPLFAGEGDRTPLYTYALVINSYIESAYRCINGGSQIAIQLTRNILNNGGKVIKHAQAKNFIFDGDKIRFVELADGRRFEAKQFISNVHPAVTLDMIQEGVGIRKAYRKRISSLENSVSVFIIYIVLKKNSMKYFNCNYYHYIDKNVWDGAVYGDDWPKGYALFTGASSEEQEYTDSLIAMTYMQYADTAPWADTFNTVASENDRGSGYEAFKKEKAELLLDKIEKKFPGLRENIVSYYTSTPLTYRDYIGTKDGSLYGIVKDHKDPLRSFISARTKVPNLFLTGQNLNMHGVLGVTIGSITTCSEFLGHEYILNQVRRA